MTDPTDHQEGAIPPERIAEIKNIAGYARQGHRSMEDGFALIDLILEVERLNKEVQVLQAENFRLGQQMYYETVSKNEANERIAHEQEAISQLFRGEVERLQEREQELIEALRMIASLGRESMATWIARKALGEQG